MGNFLLDDRLGLMKIKREFSPEQKRSPQKQVSLNALVGNPSKNATMKIFPKSTFKDFMRVDL
jgi:phosphorylcholine metabolism protein LicD